MITMELRQIIEYEKTINHEGKITLRNVLNSYPIYKEEHRKELNEKIIEHFYFREIGFPTYDMFVFKLNSKLIEIMPYYNQLYWSETIEHNPLFNVDLTEEFSHEVKNESKGTGTTNSNTTNNSSYSNNQNSTSSNNELSVRNDTPNEEITEDDIISNKYASETNYNKNSSSNNISNNGSQNFSSNDESQSSNKGESNTLETYTKKTKGSSAGLSFPHAIKQEREIFLNIDMMIIEELETLFLQIKRCNNEYI